MQNAVKYLEDMSPAARARLKLYSHFAIIFVFNAVLAALVFFTNNTGPINLYTLVVSVVAMGVLALIDSLKKFFTASGEPSISAMLDAARAEVVSKAPPAPAMPKAAADFQGMINNAWQPSPIVQPPVTPALAPGGTIVRPAWLQDLSAAPVRTNTPMVASPAPVSGATYDQQYNASLITTLHNIAAMSPQ